MTDIEILNQIDRIYLWVDSLEGTELGDVFDQIRQIRNALDALREKVEDALNEKNDEIADLKKAIEIYKEAH